LSRLAGEAGIHDRLGWLCRRAAAANRIRSAFGKGESERYLHRGEIVAQQKPGFGRCDKQHTLGFEKPSENSDRAVLSGPIEIDQQIAAEHDVIASHTGWDVARE
jgi:hypothetical protein